MKSSSTVLLVLASVFSFAQRGNVGINTMNPKEKLHVVGGIQFEPTDPNFLPAPGKTLVSDANGNATWRTVDLAKPSVMARFNTVRYSKVETFAAYTITVRKSNFRSTGTTLTLPKGKWLVVLALGVYIDNKSTTETTYYPMLDGRSAWVRASFFDTDVDNIADDKQTSDILTDAVFASVALVGPNPSGLLTGELFIDQKNDTPKTYYLKYKFDYYSPTSTNVRVSNFGVSQEIAPENFIMAYSIF